MLSAVAARKAALAAQTPAPLESTPTASGSSPVPPRNGTSKRRMSSKNSRPEPKKAKKSSTAPKVTQNTDDFKQQRDVIMVRDSDDGTEDDDSEAAMSMYEKETLPEPEQTTTKRAWSPSQPVADSSDEETPEQDPIPIDMSSLFPGMSTSKSSSSSDGPLSTFQPIIDQNIFSLNESECNLLGLSIPTTLVGLGTDDSICLLGTCTLTVLQGSVTLSGTTINPSLTKYPIFAPRSSPLPILRPTFISHPQSILNASTLSPRLQPILDFRTVIVIQENRTSVEGLGRICRTFEGVFEPSRWQKSSAQAPFSIPGVYMITQPSKDLHAFLVPPTWSDALDAISNRTETIVAGTYIVKGPKNSGKSTFARMLVNRLLGSYRRVAYLECDVGQSEFTPGGMVALNVISNPLFGPPFTHPTLANFAHFIGSSTPRSNPSHYLDAIQALIEVYRLDIQTPALESLDEVDTRIQDRIPLVVNTMGWTKGLGADLMHKIESLVDATRVFDIQAPVREEYPVSAPVVPITGTYGAHYSHADMESSTAAVHLLEPITSFSTTAGYTAADHRSLTILSYLHAQFPLDAIPGELEQITAHSWDTSRPLCAVPPYEIDCSIALDKIVLTGAGSEDVVEAEIAQVLNAAIVGLVRCEPGTIDTQQSCTEVGIPYTRQHQTPSPASSNCVGIGLIRAVSPPKVNAEGRATTHLQMLTPLPHPLLAQSRVLVKGELELPVWGMLDFRNFNEGKGVDPGDVAGVEREKVPFLQWGKAREGVIGAERRKVRRNLMRKGQM
ncbi:hypothetical protein BDN70DRAFT_879948 [Pholiota conissans]|uniref:Polynucleotide 5'-hydroxyl-kinase GRC3 n=1 Tax=Pholiota conissans TaxID=109636 RepID=A0A9P5Z1J2_9AGAR|nr:hypothetical protein BDN70DRAFT_879948 [Pholiota conissans]